MIIPTNSTSFKSLDSKLNFMKRIGKDAVQKVVRKSKVRNSSAVMLSISLTACQDSTTTVDPCTNGSSTEGYLCIDSELIENDQATSLPTIEMPSEQLPVNGTLNSDIFVANSGFLTKETVIDGGAGPDTLNLNLKNSVKISPTIKNIETLSLSSFGDYSLDLSNISDLEYILSEQSLGNITLTGMSDPTIVFGFSGNGINSTILTNNDLGGSADILKIRLIEATDVSFQAPLGYEELEIEVNGSSSLNNLLANGASTAIINGTGAVSYTHLTLPTILLV